MLGISHHSSMQQRRRRTSESESDLAIAKAGCTLGRCAGAYLSSVTAETPPYAYGDLRYEHENLYKTFNHGHLSDADPERLFVSSVFGNSDQAGGSRPAWYALA